VPPPGPRPRSTIQRRIVAAGTERLRLKGAALFFALLLWLIVSAEEPSEALVEVQLEPVITDSSVRVREPLPAITALVEGPRRELWRLRTYPPVVRRVIGPDSPEQLTFRLSPGDVVVNGASGVKPVEVIPRTVTLGIEVTRSRTVPVAPAFTVVPDSGVVLTGPPRVRPESVRVTGVRERIARLDSIRTLARTLVVRDSGAIPLGLDTAGLGVRVSPPRVTVTVPAIAPLPTMLPADGMFPDTAGGETAAAPPPRAPRRGAP
jgi:hypothetical protein